MSFLRAKSVSCSLLKPSTYCNALLGVVLSLAACTIQTLSKEDSLVIAKLEKSVGLKYPT